ncbi:MAG: hypothetical protein K2H30_02320, partial [Clostridia bacterium]|nr:hypothetical protein [Clostridia bacterium]
IKPIDPKTIITGKILAMAATAAGPTMLDTKSPSTTLYTLVNTIITIDGATKANSFLYVKCSESCILIIKKTRFG